MVDLPRGTVTFLFTDIEGSTALWEHDRAAMATAVDRHLTLLRTAIEACGGVLFKTVGDAVQAAFPTAPGAITATIAAQQALQAEPWSDPLGPLHVRMALHAGDAEPDARGDYLSAPLNRLSRLLSTGHGGQILLTQTVQQLSRGMLPGGVELRDLGEHRLRDLLEPERIFQLLHPAFPSEFPALRTLETHPHNLPLHLTPLVGREADVAAIQTMITQQGARLVTLTGPGGTGKTRLAQAVAADVLDDFPDGVFFVDLAPLTDPALVLPTLARTLRLREMGTRSAQDALSAFLSAKRMLVVLDNYEHLLAAAPVASDLLGAGPGNAVLVTSREPLRLRGEREVAVAPLAVPDRQHHLPRADLAQNPAVTLFVQRAQAVRADFDLTDENAEAVAAICRRLDGLPLAIELAAARVKVLPPSALLDRLETRLPLLAGGPRDAPARQRTLRDTLAWSHDLLSEEERTLFRRLGVFAGGWSFEAAEAVANGDGALDVFSGITSLVDKSLVLQGDQGAGEPRFTMLETIREFALEHLREHGDDEATVRRAHTVYFADLALAERVGLSSGVAASVRRVRAEEDNLRAMLGNLLESGEADIALRVAGGSLTEYWLVAGGQLSEGRAWLDRALGQGAGASADARAWGLHGVAMLTLYQGDLGAARSAATEGLDLALKLNDLLLVTRNRRHLGHVAKAEDHLEEADALATDALRDARALGDPNEIGWSLFLLGSVRFYRGDMATATTALQEAGQIFTAIGGDWGKADVLTILAEVAKSKGAFERAARRHAESLRLRRDSRELVGAYHDLVGLAAIACALGHLDAAATLLGAEDTSRIVFDFEGFGSTPRLRAQTRQALIDQLGDAAFRRPWEAGRALSIEQAVTAALALADKLSVDVDE